jgi:hypothetical protein
MISLALGSKIPLHPLRLSGSAPSTGSVHPSLHLMPKLSCNVLDDGDHIALSTRLNDSSAVKKLEETKTIIKT